MTLASDLLISYQKAEALVAAGELRQAADLCHKMLDRDPRFPYGYHLMSSLFTATGTYGRALECARLAVSLAPEESAFHLQQGQVLFATGQWREAGQAFAAAHLLAPRDRPPLLGWADCCVRQHQFEDAMTLLAHARSLGGDESGVDEHEGLCLMMQGRLQEAEALFDRLVARCPDEYRGYLRRGVLLMERRQFARAEADLARALRLHPGAWEALHQLALLSVWQGQSGIAVAYAMQAIGTYPLASASHLLLGCLLLEQHHMEAAGQAVCQGFSLRPHDAWALSLLIYVMRRQDKAPELLALLEQALDADPGQPVLRHAVAIARGEQPSAPPPSWISGVFDGCAAQYDGTMLRARRYRAPEAVAKALLSLPAVGRRVGLRLLDLGCGTGLAAAALREITGYRVGVDLSARMLQTARGRQLYDQLHACDMLEYLRDTPHRFDLIVAVDVLPYHGEAGPLFHAARAALAPGGLLAVTMVSGDCASGLRLTGDGSYVHTPSHMVALAHEDGYVLESGEEAVLRMEGIAPVHGMIAIFRKGQLH